MAEPKIRFTRDDGNSYPDLLDKKLGDIGTVLMCKRVFREQTDSTGDVPFYKIGTFGGIPDAFISRVLYEELKTKYSFPKKGNVLLSAAGTIGKTVRYNGEDAFFQDSNIVWLDHDDSVLDDYLYFFYQQASWKNLEGGTIQRLYNGILLDKDIGIPCEEEQKKIANFLSSVDEVIATSKQEVANLETQKKAVMKKIFSQEVRFKKSDGSDFPDWEEKTLESFAKRITRKNKDNACKLPLTISAEYGLIDQSEFFNKTVASKDMSTYYLLQNGEFAFNKSTSKDYPVGAIKRLDRYAVGAVSPLYICFELYGDTVLSDFAVQYFETDCWHQGVLDIAQEGARTHGLLNISVPGFFETVHELPSDLEEQRLIADFLSDFDEAITAAKKELELWKKLRKGLLQQMFV